MILNADSFYVPLKDKSVQCVVTSPPYWGLRDYGVNGQLGLEATPELYIANMVQVFREVWRVLRKDGTCWVNMGDSYLANQGKGFNGQVRQDDANRNTANVVKRPSYLKPKDLCGIPWMLAFALRADGWYLRSDIIWSKPNPMPESVTDRPTKSHEYLFLLTKSQKYFYDAEAIKEPVTGNAHVRGNGVNPKAAGENSRMYVDRDPQHSSARKSKQNESFSAAVTGLVSERNKRTVWTIATQPYPEAHFATFPEALIVDPIKAGTSERGACPKCKAPWSRVVERSSSSPQRIGEWKATGQMHRNDIDRKGGFYDAASKTIGWKPTCKCLSDDADQFGKRLPFDPVPCIVFDPFGGSGTVKNVAERLGRKAIVQDLSFEYCGMAKKRCVSEQENLFANA